MKPKALDSIDMPSVSSSGISQVFLFSKTLSTDGRRPGLEPDVPIPALSGEVPDGFADAFPGIPTGQDFVAASLQLMGESEFSVLMIRSDTRSSSGKDAALNPFLLNAGFILEQLTRPLCAIWGLMGPEILACTIPSADPAACRGLASAIRKDLSEFQSETLSMGIAVHPMAGFSRRDAVLNAWKALIHAVVVGPGSTVLLDAVSLNISGDRCYQAGDLQGAAEEYQKALQLDPSDVNVHNSLGVCYGMMGLYDAAEAQFEAARLLKPDDIMVLYNLGVICLLTGRKEAAIDLLVRAAAIDDGVFEPALLAGKLYLDAGYMEKARYFLEKALNCRPNSGVALRALGACLSAMGLRREAVAAYTRAVKKNPMDAESLSRLGQLYDAIGENPEIARLFCEQSVALAPENEDYRRRLEVLMHK